MVPLSDAAQMSTSPADPPEQQQHHPRQTPLPTRVSRACERCRRNKSRCDFYRPCSLCVRANTQCIPGVVNNDTRKATKRARTQYHANNNHQSPPQLNAFVSETILHPTQPLENASVVSDHANTIRSDNTANWADAVQATDYGEAGCSTMGIARKIYRLGSQQIDEQSVNAIPGADTGTHGSRLSQHIGKQPISSLLTFAFPPRDMINTLLEEYFISIHWFSLVIYEPRFRAKLALIEDDFAPINEKSFLVLLSTILGISAWYRSQRDDLKEDNARQFWQDWSTKLIKNAEVQMIDIMDENCISSLQTRILLGSYYVYHGRPNLSFSLLGATVKAAQAMGLHRQLTNPAFEANEERKRIWWTIYTWDRFASITYGRPLGINDKDCDVEMPGEVYENPIFGDHATSEHDHQICFSEYQRELNKLYLVASPVLGDIFSPQSKRFMAGNGYHQLVQTVTEQLWSWRRSLPSTLNCEMNRDCEPEITLRSKSHRLQSLSLQLTFDNLLIILHRPFISQQIDSLHLSQALDKSSPTGNSSYGAAPMDAAYVPTQHVNITTDPTETQGSSTQEWWNAAVRTSKVTELPQLAQLATDSHLVAFLAINLFNAAIVMAVMAVSDPLSDMAQEAKRVITRIYRLQELLGKRSTLSMQSCLVLRNVIHLLLRREAEAILAPMNRTQNITSPEAESASSHFAPLTVKDALNLPLDFAAIPAGHLVDDNRATDRMTRLNESLASVQRVFTAGPVDMFDQNVHLDDQWSRSDNQAIPSFDANADPWSRGNINAWPDNTDMSDPTRMANNLASANNGLFWFWDMAEDGGGM